MADNDLLQDGLTDEDPLAAGVAVARTERVDELKSHSTEISDLEKTINERDKAIAWLRGEMVLAQRYLQEQIYSSGLLVTQLKAKTEELVRLKSSLGWRLLNLYGLVKHRFIMPLLPGLLPLAQTIRRNRPRSGVIQ